jgi:hypothetical protein
MLISAGTWGVRRRVGLIFTTLLTLQAASLHLIYFEAGKQNEANPYLNPGFFAVIVTLAAEVIRTFPTTPFSYSRASSQLQKEGGSPQYPPNAMSAPQNLALLHLVL